MLNMNKRARAIRAVKSEMHHKLQDAIKNNARDSGKPKFVTIKPVLDKRVLDTLYGTEQDLYEWACFK